MFWFDAAAKAAHTLHSSNVDELMDAFRDDARAKMVAAAQAPAATPTSSVVTYRSVNPTPVGASGAIAAEIYRDPVDKAA